jgi:hypothetical protein
VQLSPRAARTNTESGSALILLPLISLVVVILITLAINAASLYLAQHQLTQVAEACAIQGTRALDPSSYYSRGVLTLAPSTARQDVTRCVYKETSTNTNILVSYPAPLSLTVRLTQPQRAPLLTIIHFDQGIITASATASAVPSAGIAPTN